MRIERDGTSNKRNPYKFVLVFDLSSISCGSHCSNTALQLDNSELGNIGWKNDQFGNTIDNLETRIYLETFIFTWKYRFRLGNYLINLEASGSLCFQAKSDISNLIRMSPSLNLIQLYPHPYFNHIHISPQIFYL